MTRAGLQLLTFAVAVPAAFAAASGASLPFIIGASFAGAAAFGCGVVAMGPYGR